METANSIYSDDSDYPKIEFTKSLTLNELAKIQSIAEKHIAFSLTLGCPLKCDHCIVEAGPEKMHKTMSIQSCKSYADQLIDMSDLGVRAISFTGGEPLLAKKQIHILSEKAYEIGIFCGVVTSAFWAKDRTSAIEMINEFPYIDIWDISVDAYHTKYVDIKNIILAYESIIRSNRKSIIRFTHHIPLTSEERVIYKTLIKYVDKSDIYYQRIRNIGRAVKLNPHIENDYNPWKKPCFTSGFVIRYDGSIAPCCVSLIEKRNHPFQFGNANQKSLKEIYLDFFRDPLLQMIRAIGFHDIMKWIIKEDVIDELDDDLPRDACDLCSVILTNKKLIDFLSDKLSDPIRRLKIAIISNKILGNEHLLSSTLLDLEKQEIEIEGLDMNRIREQLDAM